MTVTPAVDILIVGSGPTGLGAATRLNQLGQKNWLLVDSAKSAGGLSSTYKTDEGFLFDLGGHVIFSHYKYFDDLLDACVEKWRTHERVSYVYMKNTFVPYPFQNNLYCLPLEDKLKCVNGVLEAWKNDTAADKPKNFDEWIIKTLGRGIADCFMRPYNFKVWAYPTKEMSWNWLGERVATVNAPEVIERVLKNEPAVSWGPNAMFRFPNEGGTGSIWKSVCEKLPSENLRFNKKMESIDFETKTVFFSDGTAVNYNKLLLTSPLDETLRMAGKPSLAAELRYSSSHIIGIGVRGYHTLDKKCWLYYPEENCPFYRCTVFSNYAEGNFPKGHQKLKTIRLAEKPDSVADRIEKEGPYWSLMFEVSESADHKPVNKETIVEETIQGAINVGLLDPKNEIVSVFYIRLEKGYPTPHLNRDKVLNEALPWLKEKDVWSRGRFGAWKYEVANQDHSMMQGVEAVDSMLYGAPEMTLEYPDIVNRKKNDNLRYTQ
jgi:protoporphyrinogen oxidase